MSLLGQKLLTCEHKGQKKKKKPTEFSSKSYKEMHLQHYIKSHISSIGHDKKRELEVTADDSDLLKEYEDLFTALEWHQIQVDPTLRPVVHSL